MEKTSVFDGNMYAHRGDIKMRLFVILKQWKKVLSIWAVLMKNKLLLMILMQANIHFDDATNPAHLHRAILRRYMWGQASKHIYTIGRIHSEIFDQTKLLPPNSVLDIEFERNNANFLLLTKLGDPNFTIQMESCPDIILHSWNGWSDYKRNRISVHVWNKHALSC